MAEPAEETADLTNGEAIVRSFGIEAERARSLAQAGLGTPEAVRSTSDERLKEFGLTPDEIRRVRAEPTVPEEPPPAAVERWSRAVRTSPSARPKRRAAAGSPSGSKAVVRRWVDGDDGALESWLSSPEAESSATPLPTPEPSGVAAEDASAVPSRPGIPAKLIQREETVIHWLTELLDRSKNDQFDPRSLLTEFQETQRELFDEKERRRQVQEELEHVKRGSVAVIKYVRTREARERDQLAAQKDAEINELRQRLSSTGAPSSNAPLVPADDGTLSPARESAIQEEIQRREQEHSAREAELRRRVVQLEGDLRSAQAGILPTEPDGTLPEADASSPRRNLVDDRERDLIRRDNEVRAMFEEVRIRTEDVERKRAATIAKERELSAVQQDYASKIEELNNRQRELNLEAHKLEERMKVETALPADIETERNRLASLEESLRKEEEKLKLREAAANQKLREAAEMASRAPGDDSEPSLEAMKAAAAPEAKLKTGVRRLDELMFGGIPKTAQILLNGPAHAGKDVMARMFIGEGLKGGYGALWVVTDRTYLSVRDDMNAIIPGYAEYERRGLVRYVDAYARSVGVTNADKGVRLLSPNEKGFLEQLTSAVNQAAAELKEKAPAYRLVFESISTVTAYLDTSQTFRFLQPFVGRRQRDGAASYYEIETGMHADADLQTLEHMMDGSIHLKFDQLKTFLSVRGIGESQSRAWIGYTFTKRSFNMGSFSLDHIR
jgi:KaiC/GvpD/RAD55 family RecA-like ATPase